MASQPNGKKILLESGTNEVEFLGFMVAGETYGINVAKVRQIVMKSAYPMTKLPKAPEAIEGSIIFRDKPITVIDLRKQLNLTEPPLAPELQLLLVTEFNRTVNAFVVDQVNSIIRCGWDEFVPLSSVGSDEWNTPVLGTVTVDKKLTLILDVEQILGDLLPETRLDAQRSKIKPSISKERQAARIVYCEDSAIVQKMLVKTLAEAGFKNIVTFPSGVEGLEYLRHQPQGSVDVILSDIEMPRMDGLTLCRSVREISSYRDVPFVFFSSMVTDEMQKKCKSVGGNAAYSKPELHLIAEAIDKVLAGDELASEPK